MKTLDSIWFTQLGSANPIGIVLVENDEGEKKAYIGTGNGHLSDEVSDAKFIARTGAKFHFEILLNTFQRWSDSK